MSDILTVIIDDVECTCQKGEYIYDVAKRNGIFIPTLCRHDGFEDHRACCRICIVEVEIRGRTKVVTSCVYPLEEACIVRTNTPRILEERAVLYALLGHRAPDAQLIGDMSQGLDTTGFERFVTIDGEKCILCGLCVQACNSLGTGAISTVERGTTKRVATPYDNPSKFCIGCASCANVCPTGAIECSETADVRTIWHRDFELVHCAECGAVMGTRESVLEAARKAGVEVPTVCDECRKRSMATQMMHTYRYV